MRLDFKLEGSSIHMVVDGKYIGTFPWQKAQETGRILHHLGKKAEQYAKANELIVADAALIRTGAPFSLTDDRKIRGAAFAEAQWGGTRKRIPLAGIPSPKRCGTPSLVKERK